MALLNPNQNYTFSRYFELGFEASELAAEFGYSLTRKVLNLPQFSGKLDRLQELRERIEEVLPFLVGAVSTGTIWQFCTLDRSAKHFEQGINSYRVPEDLESLMRILVAALLRHIA